MNLSAISKDTDFYNKTFIRGAIDDRTGGCPTFYRPSGRQLRRAYERAQRINAKKHNCLIPEGFFVSSLELR